jgi:hypothetical protein
LAAPPRLHARPETTYVSPIGARGCPARDGSCPPPSPTSVTSTGALLQARELGHGVVELGNPCVEQVANGGGGWDAAVADGEHLAHVVQVQAEGAGSADEGQQFDVASGVEPVVGRGRSAVVSIPFGSGIR